MTNSKATELSDLAQPIEGWEKKIEDLCHTSNFNISLGMSLGLESALTEEEVSRLKWKLDLVVKAAAMMAVGMLKGTLKYESDEYIVEKWGAHVVSEGADQLNYQMLLQHAIENSDHLQTLKLNEKLSIENESLQEMIKITKKHNELLKTDVKLFNKMIGDRKGKPVTPVFKKNW